MKRESSVNQFTYQSNADDIKCLMCGANLQAQAEVYWWGDEDDSRTWNYIHVACAPDLQSTIALLLLAGKIDRWPQVESSNVERDDPWSRVII